MFSNIYHLFQPKGTETCKQLISYMKKFWELKEKNQWVDIYDNEQITWIQRYINEKYNFLSCQNNQFYELYHYKWPENFDIHEFINEMLASWKKTGLGFEWIDQKNKKQCHWAQQYITDNLISRSNIPSPPRGKLFDVNNVNLPTGNDRKSFVKRMHNTWMQRERRAKASTKSLSFTLENDTHSILKKLSKILKKSQSKTLEYLIHEGMRDERSAQTRYNLEKNKNKIADDLNNSKHRIPSPTEKTITKLKKDIDNIEKMYQSLLIFSDETLKQLSEAKQIISSADLNDSELTLEQNTYANSFYIDNKRKYLKPLPDKEEKIDLSAIGILFTSEQNKTQSLQPNDHDASTDQKTSS